MLIATFKVGDRVKLIPGIFDDNVDNPIWDGEYGRVIGTIDRISKKRDPEDLNIHVLWDNGSHNPYPDNILERVLGDWEE